MTTLLATLAATAIILNRAEQIAHVRTVQCADSTPAEVRAAQAALVSANVRLAMKVAKKHVRNGVSFDDLLAQACEGIVYAAGKYEVGNAASFTTYAKQWMRARCQEHVQANAGLLHCGSRTSKKLWSSLQKAQKALGPNATPEAIAAHLSLDVTDVRACLASMTLYSDMTKEQRLARTKPLDGVSAWGAIARGEAAARSEFLITLVQPVGGSQEQPALRMGAHKLLGWPPMLFDVEVDPRETHDLAKERPQTVAALLALVPTTTGAPDARSRPGDTARTPWFSTKRAVRRKNARSRLRLC